ncbi:MAG: 3-dehydroquinate synthase [Bacteroidales bacterium]|nr:3-dehydroquinate synthase [Bacteroidales bacterium]MDT8372633.1 3-dehydroquinate synthase family protein [Bacteroidales bacterium]
MNRIKLNTPLGRSLLLLGGEMKDIEPLLPVSGLFVITDSNVRSLYGNIFPSGMVLTVEPGEQSKTLARAEELCKRLLEAGADRSSFILGFGGGVICDLAGLTASIYMRGVRHGFVSTSLLSQVDASTGGKTAVNLGDYKNIIGTFKQPEFVLCDHRMLSTLPEEELQSGLGELIKHAVIRDRNLFFDIAASMEKVYERDPVILGDLIRRAVRIKASIVRRDPLESGPRRVLNFGHTFGHVLETYYRIPHGVAVTKGMLLAAELSVWTGEMPHSEMKMLEEVIEKTGMLPDLELPDNIIGMMSHDKKAEAGSLNMILLRSVGRAVVRRLPLNEIAAFVGFYREGKEENK